MRRLPGVVLRQRSMTGLATDAHFRHGRLISIGGGVIILSQACVMARGAHRIPGHAASGPVTPFARAPILLAINVEPFVLMRVESQFGALEPAARSVN